MSLIEKYLITKCIDCITGKTLSLTMGDEKKISIEESRTSEKSLPYIAPGLIDLQVNGINGIDFNIPSVSIKDIESPLFPNHCYQSTESILQMLGTNDQACQSNELEDSCVGGIHLEGLFFSPKEGAKGGHMMKGISPGMLAGAGKPLLEIIEYFYFHRLANLDCPGNWHQSTLLRCYTENSIDNRGEKMDAIFQ